jgi:hypothetical protein
MKQVRNEPPSKPEGKIVEPSDGKVVRLMPRRPGPEDVTDPPADHDGDDDDPGPAAA